MSKDRKSSSSHASSRKQKKRGGLASASAAMGEAAREEAAEEKRSRTGRAKAKKTKPGTRVGKKGLVLYVHPEVPLALRKLALDNNTDVQQMGRRALELLFAEYGKSLPGAALDVSVKS